MRLRFPKSARLSEASEFSRMRRESTSFHGKLMALNVLPRAGAGSLRLGVITSRRVGGAVDRTRLRRCIREIVRVELAGLLAGAWLVIVPRRAAVLAPFADLRGELLELVRRVRARFSGL